MKRILITVLMTCIGIIILGCGDDTSISWRDSDVCSSYSKKEINALLDEIKKERLKGEEDALDVENEAEINRLFPDTMPRADLLDCKAWLIRNPQ